MRGAWCQAYTRPPVHAFLLWCTAVTCMMLVIRKCFGRNHQLQVSHISPCNHFFFLLTSLFFYLFSSSLNNPPKKRPPFTLTQRERERRRCWNALIHVDIKGNTSLQILHAPLTSLVDSRCCTRRRNYEYNASSFYHRH